MSSIKELYIKSIPSIMTSLKLKNEETWAGLEINAYWKARKIKWAELASRKK